MMSAINVTAKTFFERLCLVLGLGTFGPWVNCPCAPTNPTVHITTISRFLCNFFSVQQQWSNSFFLFVRLISKLNKKTANLIKLRRFGGIGCPYESTENKPVNRRKNAEIRCIKLQPYFCNLVHFVCIIAFIALNSSLVPLIQVEELCSSNPVGFEFSVLRSHFVLFFFGRRIYIEGKSGWSKISSCLSAYIHMCPSYSVLYTYTGSIFEA